MYLPPYFFLPEHIIFFKKIMCCGKFVTTHYFLSHYTLFFFKKYCVADNTIFFEKNVLWLKKIMCYDKLTTTRDILLFKKNIVLWQVCHNTLFFESLHIIFFKKILCCGHGAHGTTQYFLTVNCWLPVTYLDLTVSNLGLLFRHGRSFQPTSTKIFIYDGERCPHRRSH